MCGIAGQLSFKSEVVEYSSLKRMTDSLSHRGPDGEGFWFNQTRTVGFGHRRLAIIDLSDAGIQPMSDSHGLSITFNGEIYNYLEIKDTLIKKGHQFYTNTDTEVILIAYLEYGQECIQHFDGMFSFALWDENKRELFAARDRFGEKPFFYYADQSNFIFGSEMKAIFSSGVSKKVSNKMVFNYLAYDVVENVHDKKSTFYENVFQLPPAHSMTIKLDGSSRIKKYWDIDLNKTSEISETEAHERFYDLFNNSVKLRLRSDVMVGSSLSGGLDSSSVVASIMNQLQPGSSFNTFTARFKDKNFDEGEFVTQLNSKYNFTPNYCWPSGDLILDELDKVFHHQEEPFGTTSIIAQWEVMKLANQHKVKVLLDGQGADETLAGYFKYFNPFLSELHNRNQAQFNSQIESARLNPNILPLIDSDYFSRNPTVKLKSSIGDFTRPFRMKNITPDLSKEFLNEYKKEPIPFKKFNTLNKVLHYDTFQYGLGKLLRFSDRNSMAFSREVRLPYLSHELVEFVFSLPAEFKLNNGWTKHLLRKSMEKIVPKEICWRKDKKGFQAPDSWMQQKEVEDLSNSSIDYLKKENYITSPSPNNKWKYIMVDKLIRNNSI